MTTPLEEYLVFALLLLGVVGIYILLKLHYIFAFGLVKNTSLSQEKKQKIEKIKKYVFVFLKVLLVVGLVAMLFFGTVTLYEGKSLKAFVLKSWGMIPEGFWLFLLFTLIKIALLIVVSRYVLKIIFAFLDKQQWKTIEKKVYKKIHIERVYTRIHNMIKYMVVIGIIYRITYFFPFLEMISSLILIGLIFYAVISLLLLAKEVRMVFYDKQRLS